MLKYIGARNDTKFVRSQIYNLRSSSGGGGSSSRCSTLEV